MKVSTDPKNFEMPLIDEGTYEATITGMKINQTSKGTPQASFQMQVFFEGKKRNVFCNIVCQENTLWRFNALYKAIIGESIPKQDFESEQDFLNWLFGEVNGSSLNINITHEIIPEGKHKGETREQVNF